MNTIILIFIFVIVYHTFVAEADIIIFCVSIMYYRYWVNSEQCAVYQQQCCDYHGYWN